MNTANTKFFFEYLNSSSPVGEEKNGQKIWINYIKSFIDDYEIDVYGSAIAVINPKSNYKVVIEAHVDEISWLINYISPKGYIYVVRNGGSDFQIAPSMRAKIHGDKGIIPGIFGWPAIHVRDDNKNKFDPNIENIILDIGCNSVKEVNDLGINIGNIVTFDAEVLEMSNGYFAGKGFDNKIGGYIIAQVAKKLKENNIKLDFSLYIVNAVQEEVGLRGASMVANKIKPNLAVITDVTHDTQSPLYSKIKEGDISCKKGPVLSIAPSIQRNVLKLLISAAEKNKLPFQRLACSRITGTDTDAFAYSNSGVASALISLPLKYMHTTVEMIHKDDVKNTINLFYNFLLMLDKNKKINYTI